MFLCTVNTDQRGGRVKKAFRILEARLGPSPSKSRWGQNEKGSSNEGSSKRAKLDVGERARKDVEKLTKRCETQMEGAGDADKHGRHHGTGWPHSLSPVH